MCSHSWYRMQHFHFTFVDLMHIFIVCLHFATCTHNWFPLVWHNQTVLDQEEVSTEKTNVEI